MEHADHVAQARRFVIGYRPDAVGAVLGGSAGAGTATATSDLDVVILLGPEHAGQAWVETTTVEGRLVEAFCYGPDALERWLAKGRAVRRPVVDRLLAEGVVLFGDVAALAARSRAVLAEGPAPLSDEESRVQRYALSSLLDDLRDVSESGGQGYAVASTAWRAAGELVLGIERRWLGTGKWLARELAREPDRYGLLAWTSRPEPSALVPVLEAVLDAAGGYLQAGMVRGPRPAALAGTPEAALVHDIAAVLLEHDPVGIDHGQDRFEYLPEARDLAAGLADATDEAAVLDRVHDCLVRWSGPEIAGPVERYGPVASALWRVGSRDAVLRRLVALLGAVRPGERALVGIDGFDGVGKSHLVRELLAMEWPRPVVTTSIDGFHRPQADRRAAGTGAEGFYRGSYRYDAVRASVVDPVRRGEPIVPAVWDVAADEPVQPRPVEVPQGAIVLVDGIFLQRPELADVWDAVLWVDAPFDVTVPRGHQRWPGRRDDDPEAPANARYVGGQRLYLAEADPRRRATWVLDNTDLARPVLRTPTC